jgi:hypothetical protein
VGVTKLFLTDTEIGLIKGLQAHTGYNDQAIQSIFSHLYRTINHREIRAIRLSAKQRYANTPTASEEEVKLLLSSYEKLTSLAEELGFAPTDALSMQIRKAIDIMKSAIMIYNNNTIMTRTESFIVLAVIAWTYLLHAYYRSISVNPVYLDQAGQPMMIDDGKPKFWELSYCVKHAQCPLKPVEVKNLQYLIAIRNEIEHRSCDDVNDAVQSKVQAAALNFVKFCDAKFGPRFNFSGDLPFTIQLTALKLTSPNALKGEEALSKVVSAVNKLIEADMSLAEYNDPAYAYRVHVIPKVTNNPKNADQAVSYAAIGSEIEMAIKHIERPKRRAGEAVAVLREKGFPNLTSHVFTQVWKKGGLKAPAKGLAIELGNQWFWYDEGIDAVAQILAAQGEAEAAAIAEILG